MISEDLICDTEDWSNDAENSALHHRNKLHFTIYYNRIKSFKILIKFHNFYCIFDQINAALGSIGDFLQPQTSEQ